MTSPSPEHPGSLTPPWSPGDASPARPEDAADHAPLGQPASVDDTRPLFHDRTEEIRRPADSGSGMTWFFENAPGAGGGPQVMADPVVDGGAAPGSAQVSHWTAGDRSATRKTRSGPGWLAVVAVASTLAVLAAVIGGGIGAFFANSGRLPFGRTAYQAPAPAPGSTSRPAGSIASIAAKALPSVVTIQVTAGSGEDTGSGWVFDDLGHIVTNNHVVEAGANGGTITVELSNGKHVEATIVGRDTSYDLAVLKVTAVKLAPLPLGRSADVVVGDPVIAVGAPLGLESTVTTGIVSALNRPVSPGGGSRQSFINAIQTDAAINPGNSGGPLLDLQGRVIGVNSAIARVPSNDLSGQSGNIGVGFSIPSDQVAKTVEQLIRTGKAEHPVIGVFLDQGYQGEGVKVATGDSAGQPAVSPGGPADKAGIRAGDVILSLDGRPMTGNDELVVAIRAKNVGDEVTLRVRRGGKDFDVRMTLQGAKSS